MSAERLIPPPLPEPAPGATTVDETPLAVVHSVGSGPDRLSIEITADEGEAATPGPAPQDDEAPDPEMVDEPETVDEPEMVEEAETVDEPETVEAAETAEPAQVSEAAQPADAAGPADDEVSLDEQAVDGEAVVDEPVVDEAVDDEADLEPDLEPEMGDSEAAAAPDGLDDVAPDPSAEDEDTPVSGLRPQVEAARDSAPPDAAGTSPSAPATVPDTPVTGIGTVRSPVPFEVPEVEDDQPDLVSRLVTPLSAAALVLVLLIAAVAVWSGQQRQARDREIESLTAAHADHVAEFDRRRSSYQARSTELSASFTSLGVPARWSAVATTNAERRRLAARADKRYAGTAYVRTGDAFQLVAVQYHCLAAVIDYNRSAAPFPDLIRRTLPAQVDMSDDNLNCGVLAWE